MSVYSLKPRFVSSLGRIQRTLVARHVSPDALTLGGVCSSLIAASLLVAGERFDMPLLWLLVPLPCLARLAFNALDGSVARAVGSDRPFGSIVNELADRVSDALMLGALAIASPLLALSSIAATFLTSLTGVLGTALTGHRLQTGPMGKADRVAVVAVASVIAGATGSAAPFEICLWLIVAGCAVTIARRVALLRSQLDVR